ncbi:MAG: T9SS type A sorting domain-containing protein [Flavobacteriales bacterium]
MKSLFTLFTLSILTFNLLAQPEFQWAKGIGGSATDVGLNVATDSNGDVYLCGRFQGTIDADPGTGGTSTIVSAGDFDMCVIKFDALGNFIWVKTLGGTGFDEFSEVICDTEDNVILVGSFNGTIDADPNAGTTTLSSVGDDILILKLGGDGSTLWTHHVSGSAGDYNGGLAINSTNDIYLAGGFSGTTNFDVDGANTSLTSAGENDIYILKITSGGSFGWVKQVGSTSFDYAEDVIVDNTDQIVVVGRFRETVNFDPNGGAQNSTSAGLNDCFLLKLDGNGNYAWHITTGGTGYDETWSVATDNNNTIFTFGYFSGTVDLDPGAATQNVTSNGSDDLFIQKFNAAGSLQWVRTVGGSEFENCYDIACDSQGNVVAVGDFFNTVDFDPGAGEANLTSAGNNDIYYLKLNANGDYQWAVRIGAAFSQAGYSLTIDNDDNILSTGTYSSSVDFNPGTANQILTSQDFNMYVLKLSGDCQLPELGSFFPTAFDVCDGETVSININGSLNDATSWRVFAGDCDGISVAESAETTITYVASMGTTYYLNAQGGCVAAGAAVCTPIEVVIHPTYEQFENTVVCAGTSYTFPDGTTQLVTADISYTSSLQTDFGCDSTIVTQLYVPVFDTEISVEGTSVVLVDYNAKGGGDLQWVDCNNNFQPIDGETGPEFIYQSAGSYAVIISESDCSAMSECVTIISVENNASTIPMEVYPNPFTNHISLKNTSSAITDVCMRAVDGKEISRFENQSVKTELDIPAELTPGIYILEVKTAQGTQFFKVIKE